MKFSIPRESLLKPLQVVTGVVEKRQTLPVLSNVLLTVTREQLTLTGTDLEVELLAGTTLEEAEAGEITVPARKFVDICRALPEGARVDMRLDGERALIRSGRSRFTLATLAATEFPAMDSVTGAFRFSIKQRDLRKLIEQTQFSMANQDVRYYLNGLLLEVDRNRLRAVATDGHRLAICTIEGQVDAEDARQVIIPRKGVMELVRLLEDSEEACEIQMNTNYVRVVANGVTLTSKLIDGRFPDYERVVPKGGGKLIVAEREALRQALVRTSILSNEKYRGIRLHFKEQTLRATVNNPEQEEAEEELEVQFEGTEFEIGFNVSYLLDALNAIKEPEVRLSMTDANSSCLIQGVGDEHSRYVVMPMRL